MWGVTLFFNQVNLRCRVERYSLLLTKFGRLHLTATHQQRHWTHPDIIRMTSVPNLLYRSNREDWNSWNSRHLPAQWPSIPHLHVPIILTSGVHTLVCLSLACPLFNLCTMRIPGWVCVQAAVRSPYTAVRSQHI